MMKLQIKSAGDAARAFGHARMTTKSLPVEQLAGADSRFVKVDGQQRRPTLLVWGRHDGIIPLADAERVRREIAGSLLAVIDDAGHMVQEERPQEVAAAILSFLSRQ